MLLTNLMQKLFFLNFRTFRKEVLYIGMKIVVLMYRKYNLGKFFDVLAKNKNLFNEKKIKILISEVFKVFVPCRKLIQIYFLEFSLIDNTCSYIIKVNIFI
jgi:hypothetical protein